MKINYRIIIGFLAFALGVYLIWLFSDIISFIIISGVLSFIGQPLVSFFDRIRIRNIHLPHSLSAFLALMTMLGVIVLLGILLVPLIAGQAKMIAGIDVDRIMEGLQTQISDFENFLYSINMLPAGETLESTIRHKLESVLNIATFSNIFEYFLNFTINLFIGVFTVLFLTYFFLRDRHLFFNSILLFVPEPYEEKAANALNEIKRLLSRYFIGLCIQIASVALLLFTGLTLFGVENALLIAFLGGCLNIIPYIGPLIGVILGITIGITGNLSAGIYTGFLPEILRIAGVFAVVKQIDDFGLQPYIFSNSVRAHPIEIFLVILMAGSLAGITGMMLAIPGYTVLRIIAKEFLSQFKLVKKLTSRI